MYNIENLNKKAQNGEVIYGSHVFCGAPSLTECMAQTGFDVLWIDMEHTAIGIESLQNNLIAARAGGTPSFVRIPWNDMVLAKPVIDMGPEGGDKGGTVVAAGTPEQIAQTPGSYTGKYLKEKLQH